MNLSSSDINSKEALYCIRSIKSGVGSSNSSVTWSKKFWCLYLLSITSDRICSMLVSGTVSSPSSGSTLEM